MVVMHYEAVTHTYVGPKVESVVAEYHGCLGVLEEPGGRGGWGWGGYFKQGGGGLRWTRKGDACEAMCGWGNIQARMNA